MTTYQRTLPLPTISFDGDEAHLMRTLTYLVRGVIEMAQRRYTELWRDSNGALIDPTTGAPLTHRDGTTMTANEAENYAAAQNGLAALVDVLDAASGKAGEWIAPDLMDYVQRIVERVASLSEWPRDEILAELGQRFEPRRRAYLAQAQEWMR